MVLLQALRTYTLVLPLESAYSWGLNRVIFIAAAKRGFRGGAGRSEGSSAKSEKQTSKGEDTYFLGDDMAYKAEGKGDIIPFTIGSEVQTREALDR